MYYDDNQTVPKHEPTQTVQYPPMCELPSARKPRWRSGASIPCAILVRSSLPCLFCIFLFCVQVLYFLVIRVPVAHCATLVCNMLYFAFYLPPIMCVVLVCIIFCTRCVLFAPGSHHCAQDRETCTITQHRRPYSGLRTFFVSVCSPLCFPIPSLGSNSSGFL